MDTLAAALKKIVVNDTLDIAEGIFQGRYGVIKNGTGFVTARLLHADGADPLLSLQGFKSPSFDMTLTQGSVCDAHLKVLQETAGEPGYPLPQLEHIGVNGNGDCISSDRIRLAHVAVDTSKITRTRRFDGVAVFPASFVSLMLGKQWSMQVSETHVRLTVGNLVVDYQSDVLMPPLFEFTQTHLGYPMVGEATIDAEKTAKTLKAICTGTKLNVRVMLRTDGTLYEPGGFPIAIGAHTKGDIDQVPINALLVSPLLQPLKGDLTFSIRIGGVIPTNRHYTIQNSDGLTFIQAAMSGQPFSPSDIEVTPTGALTPWSAPIRSVVASWAHGSEQAATDTAGSMYFAKPTQSATVHRGNADPATALGFKIHQASELKHFLLPESVCARDGLVYRNVEGIVAPMFVDQWNTPAKPKNVTHKFDSTGAWAIPLSKSFAAFVTAIAHAAKESTTWRLVRVYAKATDRARISYMSLSGLVEFECPAIGLTAGKSVIVPAAHLTGLSKVSDGVLAISSDEHGAATGLRFTYGREHVGAFVQPDLYDAGPGAAGMFERNLGGLDAQVSFEGVRHTFQATQPARRSSELLHILARGDSGQTAWKFSAVCNKVFAALCKEGISFSATVSPFHTKHAAAVEVVTPDGVLRSIRLATPAKDCLSVVDAA